MAFSDLTNVSGLSKLTSSEMSKADNLVFTKYTGSSTTIDYQASVAGIDSYALLHDTYKFSAIQGATYNLMSTSFFDPYVLMVYDKNGNPLIANSEANDGGRIYLSGASYENDFIYDWVAPYTGTYYVSASWNQGSYYKFYSLIIHEDRDTAGTAIGGGSTPTPVNSPPTGAVMISGTATQGQTLTAANTLADADGLGTINYQWNANGVAINGATGSTYTLTPADVGKAITVTAGYIDGRGTTESKTSAATAVVAGVSVNTAPTGSVTISGTPKQGQTLTATNTLADADGLGTINYQWKANGAAITGATSATYTLSPAEVGKTITVTASYIDGQGTAESKTSAVTTAVANVNAPPSTVTINGTQGNDNLRNTAGNEIFNGGTGVDTVIYSANSAGYTLSLTSNAIKLFEKTNPNAVDTLVNVEKLQFSDKVIHIASQPHDSYADLPDALYQFFVVGFGAAAGVNYMNQMAEAYRFWLPAYGEEAITKVVEAFTTKTQFTSVYPEALYREEQGRYYTYQHDFTQPGSPLVKGAEVDKSVFDAQMANLAQNLVNTIVKDSATPAVKAQAVKDVIAALNLGGEWTIGKVIYVLFGNLAGKALDDPDWGGTARQFANQVAVSKYYTDILSQSTDDVGTLREVMQGVTHHSDVSTPEKIASLIGVALMDADFV